VDALEVGVQHRQQQLLLAGKKWYRLPLWTFAAWRTSATLVEP
jgi:hypothetical protein